MTPAEFRASWAAENASLHAAVRPIAPDDVPNPANGRSLGADWARTLVLMQCGAAKIDAAKPVPLYQLYNGPLWQDLRAKAPSGFANVYVLSGKYGFTHCHTRALPYEEKLSGEKADALIQRGILGEVRTKRGLIVGTTPYAQLAASGRRREEPFTQVLIYGSGHYRRAFNAIVTQITQAGLVAPDAPVVALEGTILAQRRQFNEALRALRGTTH